MKAETKTKFIFYASLLAVALALGVNAVAIIRHVWSISIGQAALVTPICSAICYSCWKSL